MRSIVSIFLFVSATFGAHAETPLRAFSPESERILEVTLPEGILLEEALFAHLIQDKWYVSLNQIAAACGFAVQTSALLRRAEGFILQESRYFLLDLAQSQVVVNGNKATLSPDQVIIFQNDFFVLQSELEKWFPIKLQIDPFRSRITVHPKEKLPIQEKIERDRLLEENKSNKPSQKTAYPEVNIPRELIDLPFLNQQIQFIHAPPSGDRLAFGSELTGEVLGLQAYQFLYGDTSQTQSALLNLSMKDPKGRLFDPMNLTDTQFVDINLPSLPLITPGMLGKGVLFSSYPLNQPDLFSNETFEGPLPPGWDVELYQNDQLIDRVESDTTGRYVFRGIPLRYGRNLFRLSFYGPQGQRREESKVFNVEDLLQQPGRKDYRFGWARSLSSSLERTFLQYDHSFSPDIQMSTAFVRDIAPEHLYFLLGTATMAWGHLLSVNCALEKAGGGACGLFTQSGFGPATLSTQWETYHAFTSESVPAQGAALPLHKEGIRIATTLPTTPGIGTYFELNHLGYDDSSERWIGRNMLSSNIGRFFLNHLFTYDALSLPQLIGRFNLNFVPGNLQFRLSFEYDAQNARALEAEATWRGGTSWSTSLQLQNTFVTPNTVLHGVVSKVFPWFSTSADISWSKLAGFGASLLASFALSPEAPGAQYAVTGDRRALEGAVTVQVFTDDNGNGILDEGEAPLPHILLHHTELNQTVTTNEQGRAWLYHLAPYRPSNISILPQSVTDPFLQPAREGASLVSRPGKMARLTFPFIRVGELDGFVRTGDGGVPSLTLELSQEDGRIYKVNTDRHGYFIFDKIPVGHYVLKPSADQLAVKGYRIVPASREIEIPKEGNFLANQDFQMETP